MLVASIPSRKTSCHTLPELPVLLSAQSLRALLRSCLAAQVLVHTEGTDATQQKLATELPRSQVLWFWMITMLHTTSDDFLHSGFHAHCDQHIGRRTQASCLVPAPHPSKSILSQLHGISAIQKNLGGKRRIGRRLHLCI